MAALLALGTLTTQAVQNFWWTNDAGGVWSDGANWINDSGFPIGPDAGGLSDYVLRFVTSTNVGMSVTNNYGAPDFLVNQVQFVVGSGDVTIYGDAGTNLVFNLSGSTLPAIVNDSAEGGTFNHNLVLMTNTAFIGSGVGRVLINSNISGAGGLTMGGNYTLVLNASNSYAGGTLITNGTVKVGIVDTFTNFWAFGAQGTTITVTNGGTLNINSVPRLGTNYNLVIGGAGVDGLGAMVNNGTADQMYTFTNVTLSADTTIGGLRRFDFGRIGTGDVDLGGHTLTKVGPATTSFVGVRITDGNLVVNSGSLAIESGSIATGGVGTITINTGGTFYFYQNAPNTVTRPIIANGGILQLSSGANGTTYADSPVILQSNTTLNGSATIGYLRGVISESGGSFSLNKTGVTNLVLTAANTFSGGITNSFQTLTVSNNDALGTGPLVMKGGTLSNALINAVITNAIVMSSAGTFRTLPNATTTFNGPVSGAGAVTLYAGGWYTSRGTVLWAGSNTFSGGVTIANGTIIITNAAAFGTGAKTISVNRNTNYDPMLVLDGSGGAIVLPSTMAFSTSQAGAAYPAISNAAGNNVINGNFTLTGGGGSTLIKVDGGTLTLNGTFTPNTTVRYLVLGGTATGVVNGVIQDGTGVNVLSGVTKQDAGLWSLAGDNTC